MLYRRAGIRHTTYRSERQLWPLPFDRWPGRPLSSRLLIVAPFVVDRLYLVAYLTPLADLVDGGARPQFADGRRRPDPSRLWRGDGDRRLYQRACGALRRALRIRACSPAGWPRAVIGTVFGFAALRVKGLYLAMATLAMQYDGRFRHHASSRDQRRRSGHVEVPPVRFLGIDRRRPADPIIIALSVCRGSRAVHAQRRPHRVRPGARGRAREGLRGRDDRRRHLQVQAAGVLGQFVHRRRRSAAVLVVCYLPRVSPEQFNLDLSIQLRRHGDRRRARQRARQLLRRRA